MSTISKLPAFTVVRSGKKYKVVNHMCGDSVKLDTLQDVRDFEELLGGAYVFNYIIKPPAPKKKWLQLLVDLLQVYVS
jgi:hypothetical protein